MTFIRLQISALMVLLMCCITACIDADNNSNTNCPGYHGMAPYGETIQSCGYEIQVLNVEIGSPTHTQLGTDIDYAPMKVSLDIRCTLPEDQTCAHIRDMEIKFPEAELTGKNSSISFSEDKPVWVDDWDMIMQGGSSNHLFVERLLGAESSPANAYLEITFDKPGGSSPSIIGHVSLDLGHNE